MKDAKRLPEIIRWNLGAYTNWNLIIIAVRCLLGQTQWDPFLCVNSMGVFLGFRTAMAQGLDENMRKKIEKMLPFPFPRWQFVLGDHVCHTLPPLLLISALVRRRERVPFMNVIHALTLSTWFSFRQQAKLDSSGIYVPHPWERAWFAIFTAFATTPFLVDGLIARSWRSVAACCIALCVPWLTTSCDTSLKRKYTLDFMVAGAAREEEEPKPKHGGMARISSVPVQRVSRLY
eukprot:TRINITY_DN100496_c0_g1_i1.p1 TRINITY_DN100496_c0_g1~~TRINITY_DN100496_c0_g1_i1.p1  ORF type:complete len:274 (+),score=30.92 TRINITY_DN100496_c0_g1_i1:126-824(+)